MIDADQLNALRHWANSDSDAEWITEIWLFGSRARGDHRPDSDVDLAFVLRDERDRTAEGESICMRQRWKSALTALLGAPADPWWLNDPESVIVAPAVAAHGVKLWSRV